MTSNTVTLETGHENMIHDAQLDYYSKRLATASSDHTVRIFDLVDEKQVLAAHLKGHDGPVWQSVWAHPKFGSLLATCSYDGRVIIWKEQSRNNWIKVFEDSQETSVNCIAWAPETFGLKLAAGSVDGSLTVYEHKDNNTWARHAWLGHKGGVFGVSWAPAKNVAASGQQQPQIQAPRLASGGCDNTLRIWGLQVDGKWNEQPQCFAEPHSNQHKGWIRDVAWNGMIATASEDKTVGIFTEDSRGMFTKVKTLSFDQKVWRVSWSVMGNILAVSQGDNQVSLWKESANGDWKNIQQMAA